MELGQPPPSSAKFNQDQSYYRANILMILWKMKYINICASSNGYSDIKYMQFNKTVTDSPVILTWKSLVPSTSYVS